MLTKRKRASAVLGLAALAIGSAGAGCDNSHFGQPNSLGLQIHDDGALEVWFGESCNTQGVSVSLTMLDLSPPPPVTWAASTDEQPEVPLETFVAGVSPVGMSEDPDLDDMRARFTSDLSEWPTYDRISLGLFTERYGQVIEATWFTEDLLDPPPGDVFLMLTEAEPIWVERGDFDHMRDLGFSTWCESRSARSTG